VSDYLGAAGVLAVLRYLLQNAVTDQLTTAVNATPLVTALPPDRLTVGTSEAPQVNLYLYHVSFNQGWRNAELPTRDAAGRALTNAPLPLDLHFLLSAYGKGEFDGEILLGWAMQVLHETPVLTRAAITSALAAMTAPAAGGAPVTSEVTAIASTSLAQQSELIRIVPENLSTEDIWKLWTAFQAAYRATAAYRASVVLIRGTQTLRQNLPVQVPPNIRVQVLVPAVIDGVSPALLARGETLTLSGQNLSDPSGQALLAFDGGQTLPADVAQPRMARIAVPASIPAGPRLVRVVHQVNFGSPANPSPGDPHPGAASNAASFMLVPTLTPPIPTTVAAGATLTLTIDPPVGRSQNVALLIGGTEIALPQRPASAPDTAASLSFQIPADFPVATPAAALPLRVQVDGAQSRITSAPGAWQPAITVTA
jgi:hypothetical protein